MQIHSRESGPIPWPRTPDGEYARRYLGALLAQGTLAYFDNVDAEVEVLISGATVLPLILGNRRPRVKNSYVASPMSHYVDYGRAELAIELHHRPLLRHALRPLLEGLGAGFGVLGLEDAVLVNNWLLSTNLYPPLAPALLADITRCLCARYRKPLVFRSLTAELNGPLLRTLLDLGYQPVFSRQVYLLDPALGAYARKDSYKRDRRLQRRTAYRWRDASGGEASAALYARWRNLYDDLYLRKYSTLNPQFNTRFFAAAHQAGWLQLESLFRPGAELPDAVIGWFARDGVMTAPLVGYDRDLPEAVGLFRLATLRLLEIAIARGLLLHQSSGVSAYKMHRGAVPAIEYNLVYSRHCPPALQAPWTTLARLSRTLLIPMMRRLGL